MIKHDKITKENSKIISELYELHEEKMYAEAKWILKDHALAEDAVNQAFLKIMSRLDKLKDENKKITAGFLIIVVRNVAFTMYRKRTKLGARLEYIENIYSENSSMYTSYKTPDDEVIENEENGRVWEIINNLPVKYKDIILLEKVYGYSQKDIAKLLDISLCAVKKRAERAKKCLKEELRKEGLV